MNLAEKFITGVVAIGLVTAFATHATGVGTVVTKTSTAGQGLLRTAERP